MSTGQSIEHQGVGERTTRQQRGIALFEDGAFERVSANTFIVQNTKRERAHTVDLERVTCSECPDFEHHKHIDGFLCYHLIAGFLYAEWLRQSAKVIAPIFRSEAKDEAKPA